MKKIKVVNAVVMGVLAICAGCATPEKDKGVADDVQRSPRRTAEAPGVVPGNPTTRAGRGVPDLSAADRPAAWIYVDGEEGRFTEKDGHPWIQWIVDAPVSRAPTFRVEVYEPLLGSAKDFQCALQTHEAPDGSTVYYLIKAKPGTFEVGKEYSLLKPGDNFVIRDAMTKQIVNEIASLTPGTYGIVGGVKNSDTGREGLAITYFTVGEPEEVSTGTTQEPPS